VTPLLTVGLLLAMSSAVALSCGFLAQHDAASALPPLTVRRPLRSLGLLFSNARWLAGFVAGLGGWALYVAALRFAPLSLVQGVSAGGIALLAVLVERRPGIRLTSRERLGVAVSALGLVLLGVSLAGGSGGSGHGSAAAVLLWVGGSLVAAALCVGPVARRVAAGAGFGLAAGILYAAGDVATKAAVAGGAAIAFAAAVLACHGLAFTTLQLGFQRGGPLATVGVSTLLTNALPIVAGTTLFAEGLPAGALGVLRAVAFVAVVCGAAALARPDRS
jgi:hypothetical protein